MSHNSHYEIKTIWNGPALIDDGGIEIEYKMVEANSDEPCEEDTFRISVSIDKNDMLVDIRSALNLDGCSMYIETLCVALLQYEAIRKAMNLGDKISDPDYSIFERERIMAIEDDELDAYVRFCDIVERVHGREAADAQWAALRPRGNA